jgi:ribosomal protein L18E
MWGDGYRRYVSFVVDDHRSAVPGDVVVVVGNVIGATVALT